MLLPRLPLLSALLLLLLLLLLLAAGRCRGSSSRADGRLGGYSMTELTGRPPRTRTEQGVRSPARVGRSYHGLEGNPRDPRHKDKFIRHLTGPLYFNPKCRKHFNRLYYNTRDCTVPAYYKRCARLLIQLANSPRCTER